MEFDELIADFAKRHNVENLVAIDGAASLDIDGIICLPIFVRWPRPPQNMPKREVRPLVRPASCRCSLSTRGSGSMASDRLRKSKGKWCKIHPAWGVLPRAESERTQGT